MYGVIMQKYAGLKGESKAGELTTKLTREAFFDNTIMARLHCQSVGQFVRTFSLEPWLL